MKTSFILHNSYYEPISWLSKDQKWELLDAMFYYSMKWQVLELSPIVKIVFWFFKQQFDRDEESYQRVCKRNQENGLKWGRPTETQHNPSKPKKPTGLFGNPNKPKKPDNDNDNEKENDNENNNDLENRTTKENFLEKVSLENKNIYPQEMIVDFCSYWQEKSLWWKERWEGEKYFDLKRRLNTRSKNQKKFLNYKNNNDWKERTSWTVSKEWSADVTI